MVIKTMKQFYCNESQQVCEATGRQCGVVTLILHANLSFFSLVVLEPQAGPKLAGYTIM